MMAKKFYNNGRRIRGFAFGEYVIHFQGDSTDYRSYCSCCCMCSVNTLRENTTGDDTGTNRHH